MLHRRTWVKAPHTLRRQHSRTQKRHQATCAHVHHLLKIICRQSQLRYILRTHVPTIHSPTELSRSRIPSNAFRPHRLPHTNKQQRGTPSPQSHSQTVLYPPGQDIKNPQPHRCDTVPPQETTPTRKPAEKTNAGTHNIAPLTAIRSLSQAATQPLPQLRQKNHSLIHFLS